MPERTNRELVECAKEDLRWLDKGDNFGESLLSEKKLDKLVEVVTAYAMVDIFKATRSGYALAIPPFIDNAIAAAQRTLDMYAATLD
jgi:hypothetical protein